MKTKKILIIIFSAVAFLIIILGIAPYFIRTASYSAFIEKRVSKYFNAWIPDYTLGDDNHARVVSSKVRFRILPTPGYTIYDLQLVSTKPPYQGQPFFTAKRLKGDLNLFALIGGKVSTNLDVNNAEISIRTEQADKQRDSSPADQNDSLTIQNDKISTTEQSDSIEIKSINVLRGKINILKGFDIVHSIENVNLSAKNISQKEWWGFDLKMAGMMANSNIGFAGKIFYDPVKKEIRTQNASTNLAGTQTNLDILISQNTVPATFDLHAATGNLNPKSLIVISSILSSDPTKTTGILPEELVWQGLAGFDATLKGSADSYEAALGLDTTHAKISVGKFFSKGVGMPLKFLSTFTVTPDMITINGSKVNLDKNEITFKGSIPLTERNLVLNVSGDNLNLIQLKSLFPKLGAIERMEDANISIEIKTAEQNTNVNGSFKAKEAIFTGKTFTNVDGTFETLLIKDDTNPTLIGLPVLNAMIYREGEIQNEAKLYGSGSISFGDTTDFNFKLASENVDVEDIAILKKFASGLVSASFDVKTNGIDPLSVENNIAIQGTLKSDKLTLKKSGMFSQFFIEDTWKKVENMSLVEFMPAPKEKMAVSNSEITNVSSNFQYGEGRLLLEDLLFKGNQFDAGVNMNIDQSGTVIGSGWVNLTKEISTQLVPAASQKLLFGTKGILEMPVLFSGKIQNLELRLDQTKMQADIAERQKTIPVAKKPEESKKTETKKETPKKEVIKKEIKKEVQKKETKKDEPKKAEPKKEAAPQPQQSDEDILKVIIGK